MNPQSSSPVASYGIVVLTHNTALYNEMDAIKREQYAGIPHAFIYNEPRDRPKSDTDLIYLTKREHPSGNPMMMEKFVWFVREFLDVSPWRDCTHIVRTNASTFVNRPVFERHIAALPVSACYAGPIGQTRAGAFASGTCVVMSKDTASLLAEQYTTHTIRGWLRREKADDVVIASIMRKNGIRLIDIPMAHLINGEVPSDQEVERLLGDYPLVRVRNDVDRMRIDLAIWRKLHRAYSARVL